MELPKGDDATDRVNGESTTRAALAGFDVVLRTILCFGDVVVGSC